MAFFSHLTLLDCCSLSSKVHQLQFWIATFYLHKVTNFSFGLPLFIFTSSPTSALDCCFPSSQVHQRQFWIATFYLHEFTNVSFGLLLSIFTSSPPSALDCCFSIFTSSPTSVLNCHFLSSQVHQLQFLLKLAIVFS